MNPAALKKLISSLHSDDRSWLMSRLDREQQQQLHRLLVSQQEADSVALPADGNEPSFWEHLAALQAEETSQEWVIDDHAVPPSVLKVLLDGHSV